MRTDLARAPFGTHLLIRRVLISGRHVEFAYSFTACSVRHTFTSWTHVRFWSRANRGHLINVCLASQQLEKDGGGGKEERCFFVYPFTANKPRESHLSTVSAKIASRRRSQPGLFGNKTLSYSEKT